MFIISKRKELTQVTNVMAFGDFGCKVNKTQKNEKITLNFISEFSFSYAFSVLIFSLSVAIYDSLHFVKCQQNANKSFRISFFSLSFFFRGILFADQERSWQLISWKTKQFKINYVWIGFHQNSFRFLFPFFFFIHSLQCNFCEINSQ